MQHSILKDHTFVFESRKDLGQQAAHDIEQRINQLLDTQSEVRIIFAAAPSQNEVLEYLVASANIDWSKIVAFHMDEYVGLDATAPQLFSNFLMEKIFSRVSFKAIYLINGNNTSTACADYEKLINESPIDIVCLGIGENGHIAFNDPPVADFNDPEVIKKVALDPVCRQQQVNDGCFSKINEVPTHAYTLTIPVLMSGRYLFCVVPGKTKKEAVFQTLHYPKISTDWPSTILRNHPSCKFYFDQDSYTDQGS